MKIIEILETNQSNQIIKAVKHLIKDFYFEGLILTFVVTNKNFKKVKSILLSL